MDRGMGRQSWMGAGVHTLLINNCCHEFSTRRFLRATCLYFKIYLFVQPPQTHDDDNDDNNDDDGDADGDPRERVLCARV